MEQDGEPHRRQRPHDSPEGTAGPNEPPSPTPDTRVAEVIRRHQERLLAIDGVEGLDHAHAADGTDAIRVHLRDESVKPRVPQELEGLPVVTTVTGEFNAF